MSVKKGVIKPMPTPEQPRNPLVTVDIIIEIDNGIVLVQRRNPPLGWALPGGFVDYGETLEASAIREAKEETSLDIQLRKQFHSYSDPARDPRHHTVSTVFIATATGFPRAADDARQAVIVTADRLPQPVVFDHPKILQDYFQYKRGVSKSDIFSY
jgi:8-oxo-dGTP diphosphatase